jgi:hypothetical protein
MDGTSTGTVKQLAQPVQLEGPDSSDHDHSYAVEV